MGGSRVLVPVARRRLIEVRLGPTGPKPGVGEGLGQCRGYVWRRPGWETHAHEDALRHGRICDGGQDAHPLAARTAKCVYSEHALQKL